LLELAGASQREGHLLDTLLHTQEVYLKTMGTPQNCCQGCSFCGGSKVWFRYKESKAVKEKKKRTDIPLLLTQSQSNASWPLVQVPRELMFAPVGE